MDEQQQQDELKRRLEAERQKLTDEQRKQHDLFCQDLKERKVYTVPEAINAARIIRTEDGIRQAAGLREIKERSERDALERRARAQAENERHKKYLAQKDEQRKVAREQGIEKQRQRDADNLKKQEQEKQTREQKDRETKERATREAARNEPVPNAMQQFNALLAQSKAQREGQTSTSTQEQGSKKDNPLLDKGSDKLAARGEISDARADRAEKFARMFNPSRDKDFDPTHDPSNLHNYSNGRGGRGGR